MWCQDRAGRMIPRGYIPNKGWTITGSQNPGPTKPNHTKPGCMCHKGKIFIESCHFFTIERLISKNAGELSDSLPGGGSVDQSHGGVRKSDGISASYRLTFRLTSCPSAIGVTKPCGVAYKKAKVVIDRTLCSIWISNKTRLNLLFSHTLPVETT